MLIPVVFQNGACNLISASLLDVLIASGEIGQFLRLEGWVSVGCDSIRLQEHTPYAKEKRQRYCSFTLKNSFAGIELNCYV